MRKGLRAMGLLAMLAGLWGCPEKAPVYEDISELENPPPKPPNCPDTPEIPNIRLPNGSLADVRIVRYGDTTLYIPTRWLSRRFVDTRSDGRRAPAGLADTHLNLFAPDIHKVECPGIVHVSTPTKNQASVGSITIDIPAKSNMTGEVLRKDLLLAPSSTVGMLHIVPLLRTHRAYYMFENSNIHDGFFVYNHDLTVFLTLGPRTFEPTTLQSRSASELVDWLRKPPAKRDNVRVFTIEVDLP